MKKIIMAFALLTALVGCASAPKSDQELIIDKQVQPMSRNEVILAIQECESSKMRASLIYGKRKINGFTADVVLDVTCVPKPVY